MLINRSPVWFFLIGFPLLILGFVLPVLMVMSILESTFFLNFLSYGASFMGLIFGLVGSVLYVRQSKTDQSM